MQWGEVWRHQLRWARTIRVCQPVPYFFSILSNATFWPLLWGLAGISRWVLETANATSSAIDLPFSVFGALIFLLARILFAWELQRRLTRSNAHVWDLWLVPIKDLLQVAVWACAFLGNRVDWRGVRYRLRRDGTLLRIESAEKESTPNLQRPSRVTQKSRSRIGRDA
jgi:ceramide glucosyltransferase